MMSGVVGFACHGLLIGEPVDALATFLNASTPTGVHFTVVGGADPQPLQAQITQQVVNAITAGKQVAFIGHSKGAMLAFYLADELKRRGLRAPLFISLDPTNWGSNAPGAVPWAIVPGANAGKWFVPDSVDYWLHFSSPLVIGSPGGGQAALASGNVTTDLGVYPRPEDHLSIVNAPEVRADILQVVMELAA